MKSDYYRSLFIPFARKKNLWDLMRPKREKMVSSTKIWKGQASDASLSKTRKNIFGFPEERTFAKN